MAMAVPARKVATKVAKRILKLVGVCLGKFWGFAGSFEVMGYLILLLMLCLMREEFEKNSGG